FSTRELMFHDQSDFEYDYETLRTTGVIIGVILFVSGILIALSKKLTCSKSSSNSNPAGTQIPKTEGKSPWEGGR
uniref:FXYD domain-containing ion transport regulator n=1 Tax=Salmo trutta TaxID=8032 RepID=A0A673Z5P3_SALTR